MDSQIESLQQKVSNFRIAYLRVLDERDKLRKELNIALSEISKWVGLKIEYEKLICRCASAACNPDSAEGCRIIVALIKEHFDIYTKR